MNTRPDMRARFCATVGGTACALLLLVVPTARADTNWWAGTTDANWSTAANWVLNPDTWTPAGVPGSSQDVAFNANGTIVSPIGSLGGNQAARSLTFDANATLGADGSTLTLASGNVSVAPGVTGTLNCVLTGANGLVKTDAGTLALGGANTYSGLTSNNAGTLAVASDSALGSSILVFGGGALQNAESLPHTLPNALRLAANPTVGGAGDLTLSAATVDLGTLTRTWTINNTSNTTLSGSLTNAAGLIKMGAGTLTLSGNSSYRGVTTNLAGLLVLSGTNTCTNVLVSAGGVVRLDSASAARSNTVTVSMNNGLAFGNGIAACDVGGLSGTGSVVLVNDLGGAVTLTAGGNNASPTYSGILSGDGGLVKIGSGTFTLGGGTNASLPLASNTYTGLTHVMGGTLVLSKPKGTNAIGGDLLVTDGATVKYQTLGAVYDLSGEKIPDWASVTVSNAFWNLAVGQGNDYAQETVSNLTLYGSSVLNGGAQGNGTKLQVNGTTAINAGSALTMSGVKNSFTTTTLVLSGGGKLTGSCSIGQNLPLYVTGLFTVNAPSTGAYTAVTLKSNQSGFSAFLSLGSNIVYNGDAANTNTTVFAVDTSSGTYPANCYITLVSTVRTFTVNAGGAPVDLIVQPRIASGGILKTGNGTLLLAATNISYTLGTTVNAGRLLVNGSMSANSNVIVNTGAIFGGTGVVSRSVVVNAGGILEPGSLGLGTLTLTNLSLASGAVCNYELGAIGASDRVAVTNSLTLRGTINFARAPGFGVGRYEIMSYGTLAANTAVIGTVPQGFQATLVNVPADKKIYVDINGVGTVITFR